MISEDFRFEGFETAEFLDLIALFRPPGSRATESLDQAPRAHGMLVAVLDEAQKPRAAFVTGRGPVALPDRPCTPEELGALCERVGAARALLVREGAIEAITERAAERISLDDGYAVQWLALLAAAREIEDEGQLRFHPPRSRLPLPTPNMLQRALDLLLPPDHVLLVALWEREALTTAVALRRRGSEIDRCVGPSLLREWTGPLGGDYRRDQRAIRRAVERVLGPVHVGLFAKRETVEELLREPNPGAWARTVALREIIISPAPAYVHVVVGADAARAAGLRAKSWFGELDPAAALSPVARFAREHVVRIGSVTQILGFNPLQAIARRLRRPRSSTD